MNILVKSDLAELDEGKYLEAIAFNIGTLATVATGGGGQWRLHTRAIGYTGGKWIFYLRRTGVRVGKATVNWVWEIEVPLTDRGAVGLYSADLDNVKWEHPELAEWLYESIKYYIGQRGTQSSRIDAAKSSFVAEHGKTDEPETVGLDEEFEGTLNEEIAKGLGTMEKDQKMKASTHNPGGGAKFDDGKVRHDLLPSELLIGTAKVLTYGAKKYNDRNWEKGMSWGRVYGAMQRHLVAWWARDENDEETGFSHLWHASCCLTFLIAYEARGIGKDDRPDV